jgi:hypothetical protein
MHVVSKGEREAVHVMSKGARDVKRGAAVYMYVMSGMREAVHVVELCVHVMS